jgi:hypothetical protein
MATKRPKYAVALIPAFAAATLFVIVLSGCPQEPKTSVELLDKCNEVLNARVKEARKDLEGEAAPSATGTASIGGKQGRMLQLCDLKSGQARTDCIDEATDFTKDHLKKLQDLSTDGLKFCSDFLDKHKEFDSAAEDRQKDTKKEMIADAKAALEKLAPLIKKSIGLRNLIKDDSRAVANIFREGLSGQSPVPSYSGTASGSVKVDEDLLRLSIATGSIDVTDFSGTQHVSLNGTLTLRDRGAVNAVHVVETSDLDATLDSLTFLGFVHTGTNTARLSDVDKGFGTLEGTTLKAILPVTVENDILLQGFVTMMVPVTGQVDTAAGTFALNSSGSALALFPVAPAGFLMTSFDITGVAQGGSILVTTVPGNINKSLRTRRGEDGISVAKRVAKQTQDLTRIGAAGVVANTGLLFFVGLSADEVFIQTTDRGLQVKLLP